MPDARAWTYNNGSDNATYPYQFAPYLNFPKRAGVTPDYSRSPSPMKCEAAYRQFPANASGVHFARTYSINAYATATIDLENRNYAYGYARRLEQISLPSRMAFFMDGATRESGSYESNVNASSVSGDNLPSFHYPHSDAMNVAFIDGHVAHISKKVMQADYTQNDVPFWRHDK